MADSNAQLTIPPKPLSEFVPSVEVKTPKGLVVVPVDAEANRSASRIMGSRLREMMIDQIDIIKDCHVPMDPASLKDFIVAVAKVEEINRYAYAAPLVEGGINPGDTMAASMMRGAVEGLVAAATGVKDDRMKRLKSLGRRKPVDNIVEMKPAREIIEVE